MKRFFVVSLLSWFWAFNLLAQEQTGYVSGMGSSNPIVEEALGLKAISPL